METAVDTDQHLFVPRAQYDDDLYLDLLSTAADRADEDPAAFREAFGEFLFGELHRLFGAYAADDWDGMDLLEHVALVGDRIIDRQDLDATHPPFDAHRTGQHRLVVGYAYEACCCDVLDGMLDGLASHYGERYRTSQPRCCREDADQCEIVVERVPPTEVVQSVAAGLRADD